MIIDRNHQICFWNPYLAKYTGLSEEDVSGQSVFDIFPTAPKVWLKRKFEQLWVTTDINDVVESKWEQRQFIFKMPATPNNDSASHSANEVLQPDDALSEDVVMTQNCYFHPIINDNSVTHITIFIENATAESRYQQELINTLKQLEKAKRIDALTEVFNRRYWEQRCQEEFERSYRYNQPLALLLLDFDHFKNINDEYGHQAGDSVLQNQVQHIRSLLRDCDIVGRYGGEEFAILLPLTDASSAAEVAERICNFVQAHPTHYQSAEIHTTVSIGVTAYQAKYSDYEAMIEAAASALYQAKDNGRNTSVLVL